MLCIARKKASFLVKLLQPRNILIGVAWGMFLVSLFTPALYLPATFGEHDNSGSFFGVFLFMYTAFFALLSVVHIIGQPSWIGIAYGVQFWSLTLGNFLLLILPLYSPYRLHTLRNKVVYFALMLLCIFSAIYIVIHPDELVRGAQVRYGTYLWAGAQILLLITSLWVLSRHSKSAASQKQAKPITLPGE